jgi:hypothetical protein
VYICVSAVVYPCSQASAERVHRLPHNLMRPLQGATHTAGHCKCPTHSQRQAPIIGVRRVIRRGSTQPSCVLANCLQPWLAYHIIEPRHCCVHAGLRRPLHLGKGGTGQRVCLRCPTASVVRDTLSPSPGPHHVVLPLLDEEWPTCARPALILNARCGLVATLSLRTLCQQHAYQEVRHSLYI